MNRLIFIFVLFFSHSLLAQRGLNFENPTYDFGEIHEEVGLVMYEFDFTNKSESAVAILGVQVSCGCTTSAWKKDPIQSGESGFIRVEFDPTNRPGTFNKSLLVKTSDFESITLNILGVVIPKQQSKEALFPLKIGGLSFRSSSINLGKITKESILSKKVFVFNHSSDTISFLDTLLLPEFIKLDFGNTTLAPQQKGSFTINYDPRPGDLLGTQNHGISFFTDETNGYHKKDLTILSMITEYFGDLTQGQLAQAPVLRIPDRLQSKGKVKEGTQVQADFFLYNDGLMELKIKKVQSNCACISYDLSKDSVKPNDVTSLKVMMNTDGLKGIQNKSLFIYTNDPGNSMQVVTVRATVSEKTN